MDSYRLNDITGNKILVVDFPAGRYTALPVNIRLIDDESHKTLTLTAQTDDLFELARGILQRS